MPPKNTTPKQITRGKREMKLLMDVAGKTPMQAYILLSSNGLYHTGTICYTAAAAKLQDDTPDSNTTHYTPIYGTRARRGPAHNLEIKKSPPNPSTEVTFNRFMHFIVVLSVLLKEVGEDVLIQKENSLLPSPRPLYYIAACSKCSV